MFITPVVEMFEISTCGIFYAIIFVEYNEFYEVRDRSAFARNFHLSFVRQFRFSDGFLFN